MKADDSQFVELVTALKSLGVIYFKDGEREVHFSPLSDMGQEETLPWDESDHVGDPQEEEAKRFAKGWRGYSREDLGG